MHDPSKLIANGHGGTLIPNFDDGHVPENLPRHTPSTLIDYPYIFSDKSPRVNLFQAALPEPLVDAAYYRTVHDCPHPSWGDYVTLSQIKSYWKENTTPFDLAVQLAAHYLKLTMSSNPTTQFNKGKDGKVRQQFQNHCDPMVENALWRADDLPKIHGIAVWALAANAGSQVTYHLDYAEQIRYESNIIVPPLMAGTLQCTREQLTGGDFCISLGGISHYQRHGYKASKSHANFDSTEHKENDMLWIPYQYNQLTCHYGNLPHFSSKIQEIQGSSEARRVIVGFNVFGHDFGPIVQEAPEHSEAFREKIQVQRALFANLKEQQTRMMSLEQIQQSKGLSKLLVLAKRERIKQEFKQAQLRIADDLPHRLPATVQDLMTLYYSEGASWPSSPVDVQVYLHHQIKEGKVHVVNHESLPKNCSRKDLVPPVAIIDVLPVAQSMNRQ